MGWGEARRVDPGSRLAEAVRDWDAKRTTGAEERLRRALAAYDAAQFSPVSVSIPEPETGRRVGW